MKNIKLMKLILNWSVFQLVFISTLFAANGQESKPHIILLMTDQQRGDAVGYIGNKSIKTPHIDQLAAEGVAFSNAYSSTPSCTPARAALLTGMAPWNHGLLGYGKVARKYTVEMPQMLRDLGYYTYGIGKMHWFPQKTLHGFHGTLVDESGRVESEGFISDYRVWFKHHAPGQDPDATGILWNEHNAKVYQLEEHLHPDHWKAEQAMSFIDKYDLEAPLFLKISFARPHSPYDPPQRFLDQYENVEIPGPAIGDWAAGFADYPNTREAAFGDFGEAHVLNSKKHYYALITFLDEQIGKIIQKLKDKGMYDNSLILFVSDHGDMLGDHHHWRKTYAYEGSAKVPMVIKLPAGIVAKSKTGKIVDNPVEIRDILPTFLEAAQGEIPEAIDGKSLLGLIRGSEKNWREYIDLEHAQTYQADNYWCALTDGKEKYIWFFNGREQLFNLEEDPGELKDLSKSMDYKTQLEKWRKRMISHLEIRGEGFVKDNQLVVRDKSLLHSPNYPKDDLTAEEALRIWRKELNESFVYEDH